MTDKFWTTGGDGNWGNTNNWSATSGGGSGVAIPAAADDVFFDGNSGAGTVIVDTTTNRISKDLNFTGFTGTFQVGDASGDGQMDINGNLIMDNGATYTSGGGADRALEYLHVFSNATIFSDGVTHPWHLRLDNGAAGTITLLDDIVCAKTIQLGINDNSAWVLNGFSIECQDDLYYGVGDGTITGTTLLKCTGTADLIMNGEIASYGTELDVEFTSGTRTLTGTGGVSDCTWTYVAGTVTVDADWEPWMNVNGGVWNLDLGTAPYVISKLSISTGHDIKWTNTANDCTISDVAINAGAILTMDNSGNDNPIFITSYGDQVILVSGAQHFLGDFTFKDFFVKWTTSAGTWTWDHEGTYIFQDRMELLKTDTGFMTWKSNHDHLQATFYIWHNCRTHLYGLNVTNINALSIGQGMVVQGEKTIEGTSGVVTESANVVVKGLNGTTPIDHPFYVDNVKSGVTISGTVQLSASDRQDAIVIIMARYPVENSIDWYKLIDVLVTDVNGDWSTSVPTGCTITATAHYDDGTKHNSLSVPYVVAS